MESWPRPSLYMTNQVLYHPNHLLFLLVLAKNVRRERERKAPSSSLDSCPISEGKQEKTQIYSDKSCIKFGSELVVKLFEEETSCLASYIGVLRYYTKKLLFFFLLCNLIHIWLDIGGFHGRSMVDLNFLWKFWY